MHPIDLNCDLGESFGAYTIGMDERVIPHVTSVNVACGWHGGDSQVMRATVSLAKQHGAAVGAHPGFPDLLGFGRRDINASPEEVYGYVLYQLGALSAFARAQGVRLQHVKAHGSLYNMAAKDLRLAEALCRAVRDFDRELIVLALAGSRMEEVCQGLHMRVAREFFADRAYCPDGTLAPRSMPGAMIHDTAQCIDRVVTMIRTGMVAAIDGTELPIRCDSICVHGDNLSAVEFVQAIRRRLAEESIECLPLGEFLQ